MQVMVERGSLQFSFESSIDTWLADTASYMMVGLEGFSDLFPPPYNFMFELPSERSFLPQDTGADTCKETVNNGDAEANDKNGFHHYPMWSSNTGWFQPLVLEEINKDYCTKARDYHRHSMRWNFDPQ